MRFRLLVPATLALALAGCTPQSGLEGEVISNPATAAVVVDPADAARILTQIRAAEGLPPLQVSAELNAIAQSYANVLAAEGIVSHTVNGDFTGRLSAGGYRWAAAGENLGGGYRSLDEAFVAWNESPPHRENLLAPAATEMGIATAFNISSPYRTFWVLIVALPADAF